VPDVYRWEPGKRPVSDIMKNLQRLGKRMQ
jgi:hypothetical protein